MIYCI